MYVYTYQISQFGLTMFQWPADTVASGYHVGYQFPSNLRCQYIRVLSHGTFNPWLSFYFSKFEIQKQYLIIFN